MHKHIKVVGHRDVTGRVSPPGRWVVDGENEPLPAFEDGVLADTVFEQVDCDDPDCPIRIDFIDDDNPRPRWRITGPSATPDQMFYLDAETPT